MLNRRHFLMSLLTVAAAEAISPAISFAEATAKGQKRRIPWSNWSGSQSCLPEFRTAPATVAELQEIITSATGVVRPVGSGHSFSALVPTDDVLISLGRLSGLISHDAEKLQATLYGGTRLGAIGQPLEDIGQAMINMPDIDQQSLAGCLATATHGTGAGIGCMPTTVKGLELVTANGDILQCSDDENPEIFQAAKVSMGALGVVTKATIQNEAPYRLKRETVWREFDEIMEVAESMADNNRNFEFYYIPFTGMGWTDVHNYTNEPIASTDRLDTNDGANDLKLARDLLSWSPALRELILSTYMKTIDDEVVIESSWKNYASDRNVRFNEMEYHLPRENGLKALKEIRDVLENNFPEVFFPFECRYVKSDDIWMSPFYQRETFSIAVHRFFEEDYQDFFKAIEPILKKYHGRPHWGKLNTLTAQDFSKLYPKWNEFKAIRKELDPNGKFLNPYLKSLFT
ncbi:D-arabinono-1,4-lactone oxidase [Endozoicomonas ascidiicola]|uniref:D-arabinono-1,4-lactone oxidase n=1 Tax=Endozoicomonas ascidiicola TaxID=1698521 RepID=UPI00082FC7E2|nr:D-arabinono-1,4-lactone oxidase [Endozoicomonas ascidiicola]